ncbi:MAG: hypothetical protein HRU06_07900 [Oceanospirillaceae bacterium]|nr:hypothetical protein [Oceanospirillaceae bacterium]
MIGRIAAVWGFAGVFLFLGSAIFRLSQYSVQLEIQNLPIWQWLILAAWIAFMAYYEGYKGFQKSFSPRVAARIYYLRSNVTPLRFALAPLFCLGFFDAERKRVIFIFCLTGAIMILIKLVEHMPMPWRAIMDTGVVVGLSWGLISVVLFSMKAFFTKNFDYPAGVPE